MKVKNKRKETTDFFLKAVVEKKNERIQGLTMSQAPKKGTPYKKRVQLSKIVLIE